MCAWIEGNHWTKQIGAPHRQHSWYTTIATLQGVPQGVRSECVRLGGGGGGGLTKNDLHSCCDRVGEAKDGVGESVGVSAGHHSQSEGGLDWDESRPLEVDSCPVLSVEQEPVQEFIEEAISSYTDNSDGDGREKQGETEKGGNMDSVFTYVRSMSMESGATYVHPKWQGGAFNGEQVTVSTNN